MQAHEQSPTYGLAIAQSFLAGQEKHTFFWLNAIFGKGASFNEGNYGQTSEQQAVQQELETAAINSNAQQRIQQYNDAEQKLVDDVAWASLFQGENQALINPKVQNFNPNGPSKTWSDVYIAA